MITYGQYLRQLKNIQLRIENGTSIQIAEQNKKLKHVAQKWLDNNKKVRIYGTAEIENVLGEVRGGLPYDLYFGWFSELFYNKYITIVLKFSDSEKAIFKELGYFDCIDSFELITPYYNYSEMLNLKRGDTIDFKGVIHNSGLNISWLAATTMLGSISSSNDHFKVYESR